MYDLKVGFSCNNNCIHCVVGSKRDTKDLSFKEITDIIDKVPAGEGLQLTGGEITIRKDFYDILKYSHDHGHENHIQTNGTGFDDEELVKKCAPYLDHVLLAIHSSDEEVHNKIVNCVSQKSMYQRTINGFDNLIKNGIFVTTQTVLSSLNIPTLYDTYSMIQLKAPGIPMHLTYPHPLGNAYLNKDIVCPKYSDIKKYLIPCLRDFGPYLIIEALPPCYIHPYYSNIEVLLDSEIKKDRLSRRGYDKANVGNEFFPDGETENYNFNDLDSKRKGQFCKECFYNDECIGVWREYMDFYKDELDLFPVKGLDKRSLEEYQIYIKGKLDHDREFPDVGYCRAVLRGDLLDNKEYLIEQTKKYPFLLFNASNIDPAEIPEVNRFYINISNKMQINLLSEYLQKGNKNQVWYLDIDISHFDSETILNTLDLLERHSGLKFARLHPGFYREDKLEEKKEIIEQISEYIYDYSYPISFINIPKCMTNDCPEIMQLEIMEYTLGNKDLGTRFLVTEVKQIECCLNCDKKEACLGFPNTLLSSEVSIH